MLVHGIILNAALLPDGDFPKRTISMNVQFDNEPVQVSVKEDGSLQELAEKYEFNILSDSTWSVKSMINRKAVFEKTDSKYTFVRYE